MRAAAPATPWATFLPLTPPPRWRSSSALAALLSSWVSSHARSRGQAAEPVQFAQSERRLDDPREADLLAGERERHDGSEHARPRTPSRDERQAEPEQRADGVRAGVAEHDPLPQVLRQHGEGGAE